MRIGFDVSQTGANRAGCGWYARSLIENLAAIDRASDYVLYPTFGDLFWSTSGGSDTCRPAAPNVHRGLRHRTLDSLQSFWREPPADWEHRLGDPDLIHANNYYCPVGLRTARVVYTLYDLGFLHEPAWSTEANRVGCFAGVYRASLHADAIIAISQYSRSDFLQNFPHYPADRVFTVAPASRFEAAAPPPRPGQLGDLGPDGFWLHVGTIEPRKNVGHLLEAFAAVHRDDPRSRPLVLAGAEGWLAEDWRQRAQALGIDHHVVALGYIDDTALRWLYANCFALVLPSHFEGFGMPALEAMSLGAAVIVSATSSLQEVTGDDGLHIDPRDPSSTAHAMRTLLRDGDRREQLRRGALARAARHSWRDAARDALSCYRSTVARPRLRDDGGSRESDGDRGRGSV